jgi:hypothetical protein
VAADGAKGGSMTDWPSFMDLQNREHPAVLRALDRVCGLCGAPKGSFCTALQSKHLPVTLVHYSRAVTDSDARARGKERRNDLLA